MTDDTDKRLDALEDHVLSQDKENPGVLMRLDRLELFVKLGVAAGGIGIAWKVLNVFGELIAMKAMKP